MWGGMAGLVGRIGGEFLEPGAEFGGLFRLLWGEVVPLGRVGGQVVELFGLLTEGGDVFVLVAAEGVARCFEGLGDEFLAGGQTAPQQGREVGFAVAHGTSGEVDAAEGGQAAAKVHLAEQGRGSAGLDCAGPGDDEGDAGAAFVEGVFAAAPGMGGLVTGAGFAGAVLIAIGDDGAVVAGEDDEGFFWFVSGLLQGGYEPPQGVVHLQGGITTDSLAAFASEAGVRVARHVDIIGAEVEEEGLAGAAGDESLCGGGDVIGDVLVFPEGGGASFHVADAGDAIDDGAGVLLVAGASPGLE